MTAQQNLRAALEKHKDDERGFISGGLLKMMDNDQVPPILSAILEAMQQHRAEAIDEVEKWANELSIAMALDSEDLSQMDRLKEKLKSLRAGGE